MSVSSIHSLRTELRQQGFKLTRHRDVLLQIFQALPQGAQLGAEELHQKIQHFGQSSDLATVYNNLKLLTRLGILRELAFPKGCRRYELNCLGHHRHRFVCLQCNKNIGLNNDSAFKIAIKEAERAGLHLLDYQLTIAVICPQALRMGWPALLPSNWRCSQSYIED